MRGRQTEECTVKTISPGARLWIVSPKNTREFAERLETLLDENGAAISGDALSVRSEVEYEKLAPSLSPEDYVLFFGCADTEDMPVQSERFGMAYGWQGRRGFLRASEAPLARKKERMAFLADVRSRRPEISERELELVEAENRIALFDSIRAAINPIGVVMEQQIIPPPGSADLNALERLQYQVLILDFYQNGLADFLEGS